MASFDLASVLGTCQPRGPAGPWFRVGDTAPWMESRGTFTNPGQEDALNGATYVRAGRSLLLLIDR
jgi:hypothetical protein